jgi:hypothetical protein
MSVITTDLIAVSYACANRLSTMLMLRFIQVLWHD